MNSAVTYDFVGPGSFNLEVRIELSFFDEEEPTFAFRTSDDHAPTPAPGLAVTGTTLIDEEEYHVLKVQSPRVGEHATFQFFAGGEYTLRIYLINANTKPKLIFEECFTCK
jgi:hypothetical protein